MILGVLRVPGNMNPQDFPVIFPSRFDDALPRDTPRAERRHERVVLAPEQEDVGVRLVQVMLERGEEEVYQAHFALHQPVRDATMRTVTETISPPGPRARTPGIPRRRGAPLLPHNRRRRSIRQPCRTCRGARLSCD